MSQHCNSSRTKVEEIVTIILNFCEEYGGKRKDEPLLFGKAKYRRYIQAEKEALINNLVERGETGIGYDGKKMQFHIGIRFDGNFVTFLDVATGDIERNKADQPILNRDCRAR